MQFSIDVQRPTCCALLRATAMLIALALLSVMPVACAGQTDGVKGDKQESSHGESAAAQTASDANGTGPSAGDRDALAGQLDMQTSSQGQERTTGHEEMDDTQVQFSTGADQIDEHNEFLSNSEYQSLIIDILRSAESFNCELVQRGNGFEAHWIYAIGQKIEALPDPAIALDIETQQAVTLKTLIEDLVIWNRHAISPSPLSGDGGEDHFECTDGRTTILNIAKQIIDQLERLAFLVDSSPQPPTLIAQVKRQVPLVDFTKDSGTFNCHISVSNVSHRPLAAWLQGIEGDDYSLISDSWVLSGKDVQMQAVDWQKTFAIDSKKQIFGDRLTIYLTLDEHADYSAWCRCLESCEDHRVSDVIEESERTVRLTEGQNDCWVRVSGNGDRKLKIRINSGPYTLETVITDIIADAHEARFKLISGNAAGEWPSEVIIVITASQTASKTVGCASAG